MKKVFSLVLLTSVFVVNADMPAAEPLTVLTQAVAPAETPKATSVENDTDAVVLLRNMTRSTDSEIADRQRVRQEQVKEYAAQVVERVVRKQASLEQAFADIAPLVTLAERSTLIRLTLNSLYTLNTHNAQSELSPEQAALRAYINGLCHYIETNKDALRMDGHTALSRFVTEKPRVAAAVASSALAVLVGGAYVAGRMTAKTVEKAAEVVVQGTGA